VVLQENSGKYNLKLRIMSLAKKIGSPKVALNSCTIGVMELSFVDDKWAANFLTDKEMDVCQSYQCRARKERWKVGRILSKYLVLNLLVEGKNSDHNLLGVNKERLSEYSIWMYRIVEIVPSGNSNGYAKILWCGKTLKFNFSISYSGRKVYSVISNRRNIGLDVERIGQRRSVFETGNFTLRERKWVEELSNERAIPTQWLFTLLWSIKEAFIKSYNSKDLSVWNFPMIDVELSSKNEIIDKMYTSKYLEKFTCLNIALNFNGFINMVHLKASTDKKKVLAIANN